MGSMVLLALQLSACFTFMLVAEGLMEEWSQLLTPPPIYLRATSDRPRAAAAQHRRNKGRNTGQPRTPGTRGDRGGPAQQRPRSSGRGAERSQESGGGISIPASGDQLCQTTFGPTLPQARGLFTHLFGGVNIKTYNCFGKKNGPV